MNKKGLSKLIIILIILILIISSLIFIVLIKIKSSKKINNNLKNIPSQDIKQIQKDSTSMGDAIQSFDADECSNIKMQSEFSSKDSCYNFIAQETNQRLLCDKIIQKELKENCYENTK